MKTVELRQAAPVRPPITELRGTELRIADFQSVYAHAFQLMLETERDVLKRLEKLQALKNELTLNIDSIGSSLINNSVLLSRQQEKMAEELNNRMAEITQYLDDLNGQRLHLQDTALQARVALVGGGYRDKKFDGVALIVQRQLIEQLGAVQAQHAAKLASIDVAHEATWRQKLASASNLLDRITKATKELEQAQGQTLILTIGAISLTFVGMMGGVFVGRLI